MTSFTQRTARHFMTIKAARRIKGEIEKAGLDNLKILVENGDSIVGTYLQGCSPQEQAEYRHNFNALIAMGISPQIVLDEVTRQIPELGAIIAGKEGYRKAELQKISEFLKGA